MPKRPEQRRLTSPLPSTSLSDLASPSGNLYKTVLASGLLYKMEALWDMDQDQDGGPKGRLVQMASCVSASCRQRIRNPLGPDSETPPATTVDGRAIVDVRPASDILPLSCGPIA